MLDFLKYFFGKGEEVEFTNFTLAHFLPILIAAIIIFLIFRYREKIRNMKYEPLLRYILAFALIVSEMAYYWRLIAIPSLGPNPIDHLPISVCGWVAIFSSYMLVGKSKNLFDVCYFWALAGSVFALITPTVITFTGPTRFRYYQFWAEHLLGYVAIFYMIFVHKMRPTIKSIVKAYVGLIILAIIAYIANSLIGPGANYLFMAKPEDTPSILDILPPNFALRVLIMAFAITFLFFLVYLPWYIKDRKKAPKKVKESIFQA
ncbi:MAG: TIGR02206 family membrane protein [Ruminococcaceae bacterium]|nr:TIGR02206 family membrane protein [Oscillospiraceae bacterium]